MKLILFLILTINIFAQTNKKILFIDSYNKNYVWSDQIELGIKEVIKDKNIDLKIFRLDSKRKPDIENINNRVKLALELIKEYKPDIIIAADDNASKYLVMPYLKDKKIPVIFCGVNWDPSEYGYPYKNAIGMVEVAPFDQMINFLKQYAKGDQIGYLSGDTKSTRRTVKHLKENGYSKLKVSFVNTFSEWKEEYIKMQQNVDILIIGTNIFIKNWDDKKAKTFVLNNSNIPSGTTVDFSMDYSMVGFVKVPKEHGLWAARRALDYFNGLPISKMNNVKSKEAKFYINTTYAQSINVKINRYHLNAAHKLIK